MTEKRQNVFETLYALDVSDKIRKKQNLSYLPWAAAWAEVKKLYPDATYRVYQQTLDDYGNTRFWHDDGRTGWVDVGVTINGHEERITLAIMDLRNNAIPADKITSTDANKSQLRCLVKALALHGLGTYIYLGEDIPEEVSRATEIRNDIVELIKKKVALSDAAKAKVGELCRAAEKEANPEFEDSEITGNPKNIDNADILEKLKRQLLAVRK